jgi:iron complex outermembrane receptor protein
MQLKKTPLVAGLVLAFGGLMAVGAHAQQRIEITGSAIKRVNTETPAPIEIITREEIARTGATSINELIKNISVIDINDQGEQSSNSPGGSGTARIRMRGLGESQTLVLLNGRRVPKNPLADATGAGSAFNLNSIPVAAIERIEILKDGGSAIYGADAVAGVVNFILRKDFGGAIASLTYGQSSRSDAAETAFNGVAGYGDLDKNGFNVMAAVDVFKRDPILRADRDLTKSVDFRRFGPITGYNLDGRSVFAPQGNYLTAAGALAGQTVTACPPANQSGAFCVYDFNASLLTSYNAADRISGLLNAQIMLGKSHSAYARWIGSKNDDYFEAHPVPDFFVSPAGSPFPQYAGRFMQGGPRITEKTTEFNHFDLGVEGAFGNIDYKVGLSSGVSKSINRDRNYYNRTLWNAATQSGAINATSLTNNQSAVDALKVTPVRTGEEQLDQLDVQISSGLFKLPGGEVRYALGASAWTEKINDTPDPLQVNNLVVGSIAQSIVAAKRDAWAVFGELQLPITKTIEGQVAVRYDDYDTASSTSPKVAVKWQFLPNLAVRTSYTKSFKMPTLKQQFASAGQGAITLTPGQCQQVGNTAAECANGLPAFRRTGSNPDLQPEFGKTLNFGVIGDFGPLSVSVDYFDIKKTDNISTLTIQSAIDLGFFTRDAQNRVIVLQNLQNFAESRNTGIDVDARLRFPGLPVVGDLTIRGTGTYYIHQDTRTTPSSPWSVFGNTYATPLWNTRLSVTSVRGPWTVTGLMRTTGGFYDSAIARNGVTATTPGGFRKVQPHQEIDLTVSWTGIKNLKLTGSIKNIFDQMPPFSAQNAASNNYSQMGFAELYNVRGRFFQIGAEYQF